MIKPLQPASSRRVLRAGVRALVLAAAFGAAGMAQAQETVVAVTTAISVWHPHPHAHAVPFHNPEPTPNAMPMTLVAQNMTIPAHHRAYWPIDIQARSTVVSQGCAPEDQTCLVYPQPPQP